MDRAFPIDPVHSPINESSIVSTSLIEQEMPRIKKFFKSTLELLKASGKQFGDQDPFRSSAVIAYFAIFSLPGLLVIVINIAGYFMEKEALTNSVSGQIGSMIGQQAAEDINGILTNAQDNRNTGIASVIGLITLAYGATGIFYHLQKTLNELWGVRPKPRQKFLKVVKDRLFSFGMILVAGFLLIISLLVSSVLAALGGWISSHLFPEAKLLVQLLDLVLSLVVISIMFAAMFKFLPDAKIAWRDVSIGAVVTTVFFLIAKYALSFYFGKAEPGSVYGAAGSLVVIMLWVTYTGVILLFGAAFTKTYAEKYGRHIEPSAHATWEHREPGIGKKDGDSSKK